ncbi:hypothetical protein PR202_gb27811 [Eleusine coracana subsp. coracana]|uniref:protein-serine/threonine phosphatase n=1 Tax=Eleusine coracana subsp. coracana TaxID=191504 RepID=A0AAV5FVS7_ELECO|nr:hypothetical protein PR202_gb27811 [Eleusine coracana subsp. coracana]
MSRGVASILLVRIMATYRAGEAGPRRSGRQRRKVLEEASGCGSLWAVAVAVILETQWTTTSPPSTGSSAGFHQWWWRRRASKPSMRALNGVRVAGCGPHLTSILIETDFLLPDAGCAVCSSSTASPRKEWLHRGRHRAHGRRRGLLAGDPSPATAFCANPGGLIRRSASAGRVAAGLAEFAGGDAASTDQNPAGGEHREAAIDLAAVLGMRLVRKKAPVPFMGFYRHGGKHAADFVCSNLPRFIVEDQGFPREIEKTVSSAFLQTDAAFADACSSNCFLCFWYNCTCSTCSLKVIEMSKDHRPSCNIERTCIEASGGYVDDGYLNGQLNAPEQSGIGTWKE